MISSRSVRLRCSFVALLVSWAGCQCGDTELPPAGGCVEACPRGQRCVEGTCLSPVPCEVLSCRPEQICDNGFCIVPDPCADVACAADQACQRGTCVPAGEDLDQDGSIAAEDCDDREPRASPQEPESCDTVDNDCDGVADEDPCDEGSVCCAAVGWGCTDVMQDVENCGRCGNRCEAGLACCAGLCVDVGSDPDHCGGCGRPCVAEGCLEAARCEDGLCNRTPGSCDDSLSCTADRCDPATLQCEHSTDSTICGAGQECLPVDGCVDRPPCEQGACDDHIACTVDQCDSVLRRCDYVATNELCQDEDPCTNDLCLPGLGCRHDPVACEDGDPCTIDRCDSDLGCIVERPTEICFNGLDDDCDGNADCTEDDDCNGTLRPMSAGTSSCACSTEPLGPCGPANACGTCTLRPEGPRVCLKVDGGWEWTAPPDAGDFGRCASPCALQCCGDSDRIFACDGQQYELVLAGDEQCEVEETDRCR